MHRLAYLNIYPNNFLETVCLVNNVQPVHTDLVKTIVVGVPDI